MLDDLWIWVFQFLNAILLLMVVFILLFGVVVGKIDHWRQAWDESVYAHGLRC